MIVKYMAYYCEKCGKELNVEKEGTKLCLSCQFDFVSDKWKIKINRDDLNYEQNKENN
jgi:ribosomal protein L37AE/L43A